LISRDAQKVFSLAIPAALKHLVDILQILIDMIMVGMVSVHALAAVGMSMQFMMVVNVLMTLYVVGGNAMVARFIGQRRKHRASALVFGLLLVALFLSLFVTIPTFTYAEELFALMGAQNEVIQEGGIYFGILACGMSLMFLDALFYNVLSAAGDTKNSLYIKLLSAALNALLNYVLIFGHFGFEAMGIAGAAYATLLAYAFNVAAYLWLLGAFGSLGKRKELPLRIVPLVRVRDLVRAWHVGWSAALERGISSLSFLVFVSIITWYGTTELAGYQVGLRIEGIAFMPGFGFSIAAMALVGQYIGARDYERAYRAGIISGRIAYAFMGFVGVCLILFSQSAAALFTDDPQTIAVASLYLILVGLAQIPLALNFVYSAALRGAGATKTTLYINVLSLWLFRILPSYGAYTMGFGVIWIFIIMNLETLVKGVIYWYFYRKKGWLFTKI
jgi:putative MATE family efflux protein